MLQCSNRVDPPRSLRPYRVPRNLSRVESDAIREWVSLYVCWPRREQIESDEERLD